MKKSCVLVLVFMFVLSLGVVSAQNLVSNGDFVDNSAWVHGNGADYTDFLFFSQEGGTFGTLVIRNASSEGCWADGPNPSHCNSFIQSLGKGEAGATYVATAEFRTDPGKEATLELLATPFVGVIRGAETKEGTGNNWESITTEITVTEEHPWLEIRLVAQSPDAAGTIVSWRNVQVVKKVNEVTSVDELENLEDFVENLYSCVRDEVGDRDVVLDSAEDLSGGSVSIYEAYEGFFDDFYEGASEYADMSDEEYIETLYNCVLFRASDSDGFTHWLNRLDVNTRASVLNSFLISPQYNAEILPVLEGLSAGATCTDSDGGQNIFIKGVTSGIEWGTEEFGTFEDYCIVGGVKDGRLAEYHCLDSQVASTSYGPENGCDLCVDGACIVEETTCGKYQFSAELVEAPDGSVGVSLIDDNAGTICFGAEGDVCDYDGLMIEISNIDRMRGVATLVLSNGFFVQEVFVDGERAELYNSDLLYSLGSGLVLATTCDAPAPVVIEEGVECTSGCEYENTCYPFGFRYDGLYCDVTADSIVQRTKDEFGNWAQCQNNFECESNICSSGECIEITDIASSINAFRGTFVKVICKLSNLFDLEDYNQCVFNYLGEAGFEPPTGGGNAIVANFEENSEFVQLSRSSDKFNLGNTMGQFFTTLDDSELNFQTHP